jgi:hypothetical protein
MSKEIKFRGQRTDNGRWVFGQLAYFFNNPKNTMIMPNCYFGTRNFGEEDENGNPKIDEEIALGGYVNVKPETVGQLWKPSLNIECYGGDLFTAICSPGDPDDSMKKERIVKIIETDRGHNVVVWHHHTWWAYSKMDFSSFKHIGNVYENLELLF